MWIILHNSALAKILQLLGGVRTCYLIHSLLSTLAHWPLPLPSQIDRHPLELNIKIYKYDRGILYWIYFKDIKNMWSCKNYLLIFLYLWTSSYLNFECEFPPRAYLQFPYVDGPIVKEEHFQSIPGGCPTTMHLALKMQQVPRIHKSLWIELKRWVTKGCV